MKMPESDIIVDLIEALAETDGMEPSELNYKLSDYMDPEVLAKLDSMKDGIWDLTFRVSDHQVRITHDGRIFINGVQYAADAK
jgi:hypothetical protein